MSSTADVDLSTSLGRIHLGDCIAGMNELPAGSIDLVFADPPFNIGYEYDVYEDSKEYDQYLAWSRDWIAAVYRVLKPNGTFWLAIGDEYAAELKIESQRLGFHTRSWVIWYYTFGVNCKAKFTRSHAHLFHFVKDPKNFTFRAEALENRIPSARYLVYADARAVAKGRLPDDTWVLRPQDLADSFTPGEDTWYFARVAGTFKERAGFHGCQMPEQLLGRIIRVCSHEDDVVLDPFSGSASTLAVAKKLGRRFVGFDVSKEYVERGTARLAEICVGDRLVGAAEPTMSAPSTLSRNNQERLTGMSKWDALLETSDLAQDERSQAAVEQRLIDAFRRACDGYSLDRTIADPQLNACLAEECRRQGLPGDIRWWNRNLFRLRKSGRLEHIPTAKRTQISWETCDQFLFGSEIAWRQLLDRGFGGLDEILCDPDAAGEFDRLAAALAPGFTPLEYRWGALKLRKESKRARERASALKLLPHKRFVVAPAPISEFDLSSVEETAGIYLLTQLSQQQPLFAGESLNLRSRLVTLRKGPACEPWESMGADLGIQHFSAESSVPTLIAYQSACVRRYRPRFNVTEPA